LGVLINLAGSFTSKKYYKNIKKTAYVVFFCVIDRIAVLNSIFAEKLIVLNKNRK